MSKKLSGLPEKGVFWAFGLLLQEQTRKRENKIRIFFIIGQLLTNRL
jgi:hypothetical protein